MTQTDSFIKEEDEYQKEKKALLPCLIPIFILLSAAVKHKNVTHSNKLSLERP